MVFPEATIEEIHCFGELLLYHAKNIKSFNYNVLMSIFRLFMFLKFRIQVIISLGMLIIKFFSGPSWNNFFVTTQAY